MLQKIPVKKEYLLIGASVILLWISYQLAFRKTFEACQLNKQLTRQIAQGADVSVLPDYLERKNHNLDKIISLYKTDTVAFRSNIINTIASIAEKQNVKLSEVPMQDPLLHADKFIIQKLDFEGSYFDLIKTLDRLQKTEGIGVIRSAVIRTVIERSNVTGKEKIILELYFEMAV